MASALDTEDDIPLPADVTSTAATESTAYDALFEQPQSALGGGDYGGGAPGVTGGGPEPPTLPIGVLRRLADRATANPAPEGTNRAALQRLVKERMAAAEKAAASGGEGGAASSGFDASRLQKQFDPDAPDLELSIPKPEEPPPEKPGIVGEAWRGVKRGATGLLHELEGVANTVEQKLADWTGSEWLAATAEADKKALAKRQQEAAKEYGATVPNVVAAFNDPANATRYVAGKAGEIIPMLAGYVYAGLPRMVMFGAMEGASRAAEENNGDLAATVTGAAVGAAVAGAPAPFLHGAAGKSLWNNIARATLGMPLVAGVSEAAQVLPKAAAGSPEWPKAENIAEAVAGGVVSGPLVGAVGYRASRGRAPGEVTPGVTEEQKAALDLTKDMEVPGQQPPLELTPDMVQRALPPPSPENRPPVGPAPPGEAPPASAAPDVIAGQPPPGGGGQPVDFTIGQPPAGPAPPAAEPPAGPVPPPRPQPFAPTERPVETQPTRPSDFGVGAPVERPAQPPPPMTTPEEFGIGRPPGGEEPPPPAGPGGPPPPPRPQPFPPSDRPTEQRPTRPEDFAIGTPEQKVADVGQSLVEIARGKGITTEPDDLNKGMFVAKVNEQVAGKGATEHEAVADLISRKGAAYPPEPGEVAPAGAAAPKAEAQPRTESLAEVVRTTPEPVTEPARPARDVTEDVRTSRRSDKEEERYNKAFDEFSAREERVLAEQKRSDTSRANELERRQGAWDQGFEAGLRDGTMPAGIKQNVVNHFREGRELGRQIREGRMAAKSTAEKAAEVKAKGEARKAPETKPVTEPSEAPGLKKPPTETVTKPVEPTEKTAPDKTPAERTVYAERDEPAATPDEAAAARYVLASREQTRRVNDADLAHQRELGLTPDEFSAAMRHQVMGSGPAPSPEVRAKVDAVLRRRQEQPPPNDTALRREHGAKAAEVNKLMKLLEGKTPEEIDRILRQRAGEAAEPAPKRTAPPKETSTMAREARADLARDERKALMSEATRKMAEAPPREEQYPVTPGLETTRKAQAIIKNILAGQPLAAAVKAFGGGPREPGQPGRPANIESLSQYIRQELRTADQPTDFQAAQKAAMDRAAEALKKLDPESPLRTPILNELNKQLNYLEQLKSRRPQLEAALKDIEAIERGESVTQSRRVVRDIGAAAVRMFSIFTGGHIKKQLAQAGERGASLHDLLDTLAAHPAAARLTPQVSELAKILRKFVPDTTVHEGRGFLDEGVAGEYDVRTQKIHIDTGTTDTAQHLLHETVHRGTADYVTYLYRTPEVNLTPRELSHKTALEAIRREVERVANEGPLLNFHQYEAVDYATRIYETNWLSGPHELATQLLTNPDVYQVLMREGASPQFRQALDNVGLGISSKASIWDGFKRVMRSIFGVPERLDSVFDYAMRPLAEILEVGGMFAKGVSEARTRERLRDDARHNDQVLGAQSRRTPHSKTELEEAVRRLAINVGDPAGRASLTGALHTASYDAVHDLIKPYVPAVEAYRAAQEAIVNRMTEERAREYTTYTEDGRKIVEPHKDKSDRLFHEMEYGPDGRDAQALMTDITMAKADLFDPKADNSHVPEKVLQDLQDRYARISPAARNTMRETAQVYGERAHAERTAEVRQFVDAIGGFTRAQTDDIVRHMSTLGGIEDIIQNTDRSTLIQRLGPRAAQSVDLFKQLAESQQKGFVKGTYYPANRHGEYVIAAGQVNTPEYLVRMFERPSQAKEFKAKLELERNDVSQMFVKTDPNFRKQMVPDQALAIFDKSMQKAGVSEDRQKVLRELYAGELIRQGMRQAQRSMKREYISGASNEQARNLQLDFLSHTTRMGHLAHQGELIRAYFQAEKEVRMLHQPGQGPNLDKDGRPRPQASAVQVAVAQAGVRELQRRMTSIDGDNSADQLGRGVRALTGLTVVDSLIRPAYYAMQLAGTHAFGSAMIGGRRGVGPVTALAELTKAYAQLTGTVGKAAGRNAVAALAGELKVANWMLSEVYRKRLHEASDIKNEHADLLIDDFVRSNLINQSHSSEVRRMAGPDTWRSANGVLGAAARLLDVSTAGEHALDSGMRVAVGKAAFVTELRANGGDVLGALAWAKHVARKAMPDWNYYNRPRLTTKQGAFGQLGSLLTQFKGFGFHAYGVQGNLIVDMFRKGTQAERREAMRTLALLHTNHAIMWAGIGGTVFNSVPAMVLGGIYDLINGENPHTNRDLEVWSRNYVKDWSGSKTIADIYQYGLPALGGINASPSLRFSNLIGVQEIRSYDAPGFMEFGFKTLAGAGGQVAEKMMETAIQVLKGDTRLETLMKFAPRVIEDPVQAYSLATKGYRTAKGDKQIIAPEQLTGGDIAAKALGFLPVPVTDAQMARATENRVEKTRQDMQEPLLRNLAQAVLDKDKSAAKAAMDEISRFNKAMPKTDAITGQQIQSRLKQQAVSVARPTLYGMNVPKKQYGHMEELTRFARP